MNMKRILEHLLMAAFCTLSGCLSITSELKRAPSSTKLEDSLKTTSDMYLKYQLMKNSGLEKITTQDCKAFAQLSPSHCETEDCKAILNEQDSKCKDGNCKAFINRREEQCTDDLCRALIRSDVEKCGSNRICRSVIDNESLKCDGNSDCKGLVDKSGGMCQSAQCRALVYENFTFCEK